MHKFHNSKKIRIIKKINIGDVYKPFTSDWQAVNKKKPQLSRFSLYLQLNGSVTSGWTDYITICFKCPRTYFFNFNFSDSLKHSVNK
jgi:hypothetical protein